MTADLEVQAREEARDIVRAIHWMARRYADGRMTCAVCQFNDAVRPAFEAGWLTPLGGEPQYARDGMFDQEWRSIEDRLTTSLDRVRVLEERLARVLEWWPEGSEIGRLDKGGSFAVDIQEARQALVSRAGKARGL